MANINNFYIPFEVCSIIVDYTHHEDLISLSRVCKSFKRVAQPQLYKDIDLKWYNTWIFDLPPHYILLHTILNNPDIAALIQTLRLGRNVSDEPWNGAPPLPPRELERAREKLHDLKIPAAETWTQCLALGGNGSLDVALVCLLLLLPNLRAFDLNTRFDPASTVLCDMMQSVLDPRLLSPSPRLFRSLKRIEYLTSYELHGYGRQHEFSDFQSLFYLPSIETIRAGALEPLVPFSWPTGPPNAERLTALHLRQSHVREETLAQLFSVTPNLKTFEYEFRCDVDFNILHRGYLDCDKLGVSLQKTKASLETLIISPTFFARTAHEVDSDDLAIGYLGSLSEFPKLRMLHVPLVVLLGWTPHLGIRLASILPFDLLRLCCTGDMDRWYSWAWPDDAILDQFREYFNAETSLELGTLQMFSLRNSLMQQELETICEDAGIFYENYHGGQEQ